MDKDAKKLSDDDLIALLSLWRCPFVGPVRFRRIFSKLSHPSQLLDPAMAQDISEFLPENARNYLIDTNLRAKLIADAEADLKWQHHSGHQIIYEQSSEYPQVLRSYADAPPLLFTLGNAAALAMPQLAVVGSRRPSGYGRRHGFEFSQLLSENGLIITSGLALGIDTVAHQGALAGSGKTIAVLAHGLDQVYPATNRKLAQQIIEHDGVLISEFPIGVSPQRQHFPRRNRIMSALSLGVLVVEAALKSGSLITARLANEQGKEVFAIPGSVQSVLSKGCHELIRQGATLVESVKDIVEVISPLMANELVGSANPPIELSMDGNKCAQEVSMSFTLVQRQIINALEPTPISMDEIISRTGLAPRVLLTELMVMELQSLISTVPGGYQLC